MRIQSDFVERFLHRNNSIEPRIRFATSIDTTNDNFIFADVSFLIEADISVHALFQKLQTLIRDLEVQGGIYPFIYSWGCNQFGKTAQGTKNGYQLTPKLIEATKGVNIVDVAATLDSTSFLTSDGDIYYCGLNNNKDLSTSNTISTPISMHFLYDRFTKITATKDVCTMALTDDNQIIAYTSDGDMYRIERVFAYGTTKIVDICAGYGHGYCIDTDGHLYKIAYSNNRQNQVQQEAIPFKLKSLACSYNHELAIADDNRVYGRGSNSHGQLGLDKHTRSVANFIPITALDREIIVQVAQGTHFSLFLTSAGQVYFAGSYSGETNVYTPQRVVGLDHVTSIAAAERTAFALTTKHQVITWGVSICDTCGENATVMEPSQVLELHGRQVSKIVAGHSHVFALCSY